MLLWLKVLPPTPLLTSCIALVNRCGGCVEEELLTVRRVARMTPWRDTPDVLLYIEIMADV